MHSKQQQQYIADKRYYQNMKSEAADSYPFADSSLAGEKSSPYAMDVTTVVIKNTLLIDDTTDNNQ